MPDFWIEASPPKPNKAPHAPPAHLAELLMVPPMPETIPADITAAIKNLQSAARREGALGIGTQASAEAENAASEARKRLERAIANRLRGYAGLKAAMDAITSGGA